MLEEGEVDVAAIFPPMKECILVQVRLGRQQLHAPFPPLTIPFHLVSYYILPAGCINNMPQRDDEYMYDSHPSLSEAGHAFRILRGKVKYYYLYNALVSWHSISAGINQSINQSTLLVSRRPLYR